MQHADIRVAEAPLGRRGEVRAAEYLRMSTEHQRYSIDNQTDFIRRYAAEHGITIVRTYMDYGKSGLQLKGRTGLQTLLKDIQARSGEYSVVIVFDVTRWGRFQDIDESAHYEYLCRQAGVRITYCAEAFPDDESPLAFLGKGMSRYMAADDSRKLSMKVFNGQCRLIRLGYRQGAGASDHLLHSHGVAVQIDLPRS